MITEVIEIDPINHQRVSSRRGNGLKVLVQFTLAGKAAIHGVAAVVRVVQLGRRALPMRDADPGGLIPGFPQQMRRQGWGDTCYRQSGIAVGFVGHRGNKGAVDPTGIGHTKGRLVCHPLPQVCQQLLLSIRQRLLQPKHQRGKPVELGRLQR